MKLLFLPIGCLAFLTATFSAFAAAPSTNAAPVNPAPAPQAKSAPADANAKPATATNAPPVPATASQPAELKLDDYLKDLTDTLKISDDEKKAIQTYYLADGTLLKNILNNDALSPLQQARQVSDLRDARNAKINALLQDVNRQRAFLEVEAKYRVALTELAADGGLVPAQTPPPAPSAVPPAQAEKIPTAKGAAK
jgi:hypothetical protein